VLVNRRNVVFVLVTVLGTLFDQLTKWWVIQNIALGNDRTSALPTEIPIIPGFLSFVHAQNPGAAFGIMRDFEYRHWIFLVFSVIATGIVVDLVRKLPKTDFFMSLTLGLILSGAFGNAIDRVRMKVVTDFIKVYTDNPDWSAWFIAQFGTNEWPSFNVADANLVVGVILFLIYTTFFDETKVIPEEG
jgi:signal peptidase II